VRRTPGHKPFARSADVAFGTLALALASPLLAVSAAVIKMTSPGPVFFRQTRIGLHGKPFTILKLRTMRVGGDDRAWRELCRRELEDPEAAAGTRDGIFKLQDDPRVTSAGRILRRLSIDEVPQLLNVLRGDMSVVGPRPLAPFEVELHSPYHLQRSQVRPGLTGAWQVQGRNKLNARQMLDLDVQYVRGRSWAVDLALLARTPAAVLRGDGAR
jgi:lipopolysaccharide/colanic/teichoic acid biosynthesis glycosyltransferase